ncbi:MAG TPA: PrgI family protein [Mycobacteriales bacterium]|nr:PrgI family protein [Mycobacteriales bacterium]
MTEPVRIPADVERPDRVLANLTGRQVAILTATAAVLYLAWTATRTVIPPLAFLALAAPVAAAAAALALGSRDGMSLDRLAVAAIRQRLAPAHRVTAPEGVQPAPTWLTPTTSAAGGGDGRVSPVPLRLPAHAVAPTRAGQTGVVDLGSDGLAVVAVCSTVNFALRTPAEQDSLVGVFGRWLHSLTAPVQLLVRAERLDLTAQITDLRERAPGLPHPALEAAAVEHADYLTQLAERTDLLRRQVLLVLREPAPITTAPGPGPGGRLAGLPWRGRAKREGDAGREAGRRAAEARLARRLAEAGELLAPAGITVTGLDPAQATAVLTAACNPDHLIPAGADLAAADEVITTTPDDPDTGLPGADWDGRWAA